MKSEIRESFQSIPPASPLVIIILCIVLPQGFLSRALGHARASTLTLSDPDSRTGDREVSEPELRILTGRFAEIPLRPRGVIRICLKSLFADLDCERWSQREGSVQQDTSGVPILDHFEQFTLRHGTKYVH